MEVQQHWPGHLRGPALAPNSAPSEKQQEQDRRVPGRGEADTSERRPRLRRGPQPPRSAHLDSADQSFLPADIAAAAVAACVLLRPPPHLRPAPARWGHMAAYLTPRAPRRRAATCRPGSGLWGVGVPDKAALISARAGRGSRWLRAACCVDGRTGRGQHRRAPGLARGCLAARGEGGRRPAQNQSDQPGAGPPRRAGSPPECQGAGRRAGTRGSGR